MYKIMETKQNNKFVLFPSKSKNSLFIFFIVSYKPYIFFVIMKQLGVYALDCSFELENINSQLFRDYLS